MTETIERLGARVASGELTADEAARIAARLQAASVISRRLANRDRQERAAATVQLPAIPGALNVQVNGKHYSIACASHYRKPDGSHGVRAVPVVQIKTGRGRGVAVTRDLLALIDSNREQINVMLGTSDQIISTLRSAA